MNKKIISLLALFVLSSVMSQAQDSKRHWPNMFNNLQFGLHMAENNLFEARFILHLKNEIGLTPDQEQKIENMMLTYHETAIRRGSDIKVMELKFASLLNNNRIDRSEMEKMARAMGKLKTELQVNHLNYLLDLREILTPEQIKKIEKIKKETPECIRGHLNGGRRGDFPPPPPKYKEEPPSQTDIR